MKRFARALSWVAVASSTLVLVVSGGLYAYVSYVDGQFHDIGHLCVRDCGSRPPEATGTENFLLVGSDTRAGGNSSGPLGGLANGSGGNGLSDTTMLIHISADTSRVVGLSFPRDLLVRTPSYETTAGPVPSRLGKFNAAYSLGGPQLLVKQVEALTRVKVDHYVGIDLRGFVNIVDALGGIDVCLSAIPGSTGNLRDPGALSEGTLGSGFVGHVGINHLSGLKALAFVRQRHGLPNQDLDRIQRQHRFLSAVLSQVRTAGTLLNPLKLNRVVSALARDMSKDDGTSFDDLVTLGRHLQGLDSGKVEFFTLPTVNGPLIPGIGAVLLPVAEADHALIQAIHDDRDPSSPQPASSPPPAGPARPSAVPADRITLAVDNASGMPGRAAAQAAALVALGFHVPPAQITTSSGPVLPRTVLRYAADQALAARTVAAAVPDALLRVDPSLAPGRLVLDVGSGSPRTSPAQSAAPSPAITVKPDTKGSAAGGCGP